MELLNEQNLSQPSKTIYNSDEVKALGFRVPAELPPPEPTTCRFCGKRLCYEAIVLFGSVILWRRNEPERCDCKEAADYWKEQDAFEEQRGIDEELRQQREERQKKITRLLGSSGIKARFAERTFENFVESPENKQALMIAKKYADHFVGEYYKRGYGIYFEGTKGTGKTHLAVAIALQLLKECVPVVFRTSIDLLAEIRKTYDDRSTSEEQIMSAYATADLLIIDDLGKEKSGEWTADRLFAIINERYENMKPIIITTNYSQAELIKRWTPANGDSKTAEAIISRLRECTGAVPMMGEDWRFKVRRNNNDNN